MTVRPEEPVADPVQLARMWSIFPVDQEAPIALRALWPASEDVALPPRNITFTPAEFPDVEQRKQAFAEKALLLNERGYNIYTTLNPVSPRFRGNLNSGLAVKDADISCRRRLLIDLDRAVPSREPATDAEIASAGIVADQIQAHLSDACGVVLLRVLSGNGVHLYLPLANLPNDAATHDCCRRLLHGLAKRFDTPEVKVDVSVHNAARITKVPGTIARKGLASPGRPHRMASVL